MIPLFLIVIFQINFWSTFEDFNVEEIELIKYDINLAKINNKFAQPDKQNQIVLSSKYGEKFYCSIPDIKFYKPLTIKNVTEFKKNITAILKPLSKAPCLNLNKGWWTYEFCYKRHIHQYHLQDGKVRGMQTFLGTYLNDYNWTSALINSKKYVDENYHMQFYNNGTYCDTSKMPREATVKFYCTTKSDYISDVEEYQPCSYMVHVHTKHLCKNSFFNKQETQSNYKINCQSQTSSLEQGDIIDSTEEQEMDIITEEQNLEGIELNTINVENREKKVEELVGINLDDTGVEETSESEHSSFKKSGKSAFRIVFNKEAFEDKLDERSLVKLLVNNLFRNDKSKERKRFTKLYDAYYSPDYDRRKSKANKNKKDLIIF